MMLIRSLLYFFGEALKSVVRQGWMSLASIAVVAITLLILGSFMILNYNVGTLVADIKDQIQIVVYIDEDEGADTRSELNRRLVTHPELEEVRYVSKKEAMDRLKIQLGERAYLLEGYEDDGLNPLRDSYELRLKVPENVSWVAEEISRYPGASEVNYGEEFVKPLFDFTGIVRWIGLAFMGGLAVTAVFLIAHTIRLTVYIRRREVQIMKYVGATDWFIRWPFIIEGLFLGLLGALIPVIGIQYGYQEAFKWIEEHIHFIALLPPELLGLEIAKLLIPLGAVLGVLGSTVSLRRFLKV